MQPDVIYGLKRFRLSKQTEISRLELLAKSVGLPVPFKTERPSFSLALSASGVCPAVIAEYKRASPAEGVIDLNLTPEDVAEAYAGAGAACISVLTEEIHFQGHLEYLSRMARAELPLLRKDFIFHPLQIAETATTPASALLLIVRLTPDVRSLRDLREKAEEYGMEAVVEIFDEKELQLARESGARIIQVNARNLETLVTDREACLRLASLHPPLSQEIWIAASGMERAEHLRAAADNGYHAVLIGTALMREGRPGHALSSILRALPCAY